MRNALFPVALSVLVATIMTACSNGGSSGHDDHGALSVQAMSKDKACPVDLVAAAKAAGLKPRGTASHSFTKSSSNRDSAAAKAKAVDAECGLPLRPSGTVDLTVLGSDRGNAANLTLPALLAAGQLGTSAAQDIAKSAQRTGTGSLVDLPDSVPGALAVVPVPGKKSGAFMVLGSSLTRNQARTIAQQILDQL
jgi:hypothetical protein